MGEFKCNDLLKEKDEEENLVYTLQKKYNIDDCVKFPLNNNDLPCECYFKDGNIILTEKNSDTVIEDENLRNKVFYGLATSKIKPLFGRITYIPNHGYKYYYWRTTYERNSGSLNSHSIPIVDYRYWNGSIEDYLNLYAGNCFSSEKDAKNACNTIEEIKQKVRSKYNS